MKIDDKILLDTNILVYFLNEDSEFYDFSRAIINNNSGNIYIAQKSISEWVAVFSKLDRYDIIEDELEKIIIDFNILYVNDLSLEIFSNLIKKYKPRGNRVYDFEITSVMLANEINKIVTINTDDFKNIDELELISKSN